MATQSDQSGHTLVRSSLLLFGAYAFAYSVLITVHELGHALVLRAFGVTDVKVVLHPFTGSRTIWDATDEFIGTVDAAGPLAAILVGTIVTAVFWVWRRPVLMPFLLFAPVAYLTEGLSNFMQVALRSPGSDALRMIAAGVPESALIVFTVVIFLAGIVVLLLLLPLLNLSPAAGFWEKALTLAGGLGGFMLLRVVYGLLVDDQALSRNGPQLAFALLMGVLLAALFRPAYRLLGRLARTAVMPVEWPASWVAVILGVGVVVIQLAFFSGVS
ncbi:MAG: hypothetical protein JW910_01055 [Anaerolineae bacterium]|nr:hypothetical protein [Anaerolineae bacterium]